MPLPSTASASPRACGGCSACACRENWGPRGCYGGGTPPGQPAGRRRSETQAPRGSGRCLRRRRRVEELAQAVVTVHSDVRWIGAADPLTDGGGDHIVI